MMDHANLYKLGSYIARHVISIITGENVGSVELDESLGKALNEIRPASELMADPLLAKGVAMACGAWPAVKKHEEYVNRKVQEAIANVDQRQE